MRENERTPKFQDNKVRRAEQGAFYHITDNSGKFLSITLGYKDASPEKCLEAVIAPYEGSNLYSFKAGGRDFIWYDPELPLADFLTGTPVLFPFPNRIEDAVWTWKGKAHLQKKDGIPVQLHSLVYDEKSWKYSGPDFRDDAVFLTTYIEMDENHPIFRGFPFKCTLSLTFALTSEKLTVSYRIENSDSTEIPFGFALHPYFAKLSGEDGTLLCVPCRYWYELRDDADKAFLNKFNGGYAMVPNLLPTGRLMDADTCGLSLKNPAAVGTLDLDHVYTGFIEGRSSYIDYASLGMRLKIIGTSDFTHNVVYTPKGRPFFCIEPQTCSTDAINLHAKGIEHAHLMVLPPKCVHTGSVDFIPERC